MQKRRNEELSVIWEEKQERQISPEQQRRRKQQRARRKKRAKRMRILALLGAAVCLILVVLGLWRIGSLIWKWSEKEPEDSVQTAAFQEETEEVSERENPMPKPEITEDFLTPNEYSRPQEELLSVDEIFVHYTANPGTTAAQNRSYFENLGLTGETSASAHFVIGYEGEIVQCLPLDEIGYAVMEHNYNSISIECCYLDESGEFTEATKQSLTELLAWLLWEYDLSIFDVKRHYDASGKLCPLYYAENQDAWEYLLADVDIYMEQMTIQAGE